MLIIFDKNAHDNIQSKFPYLFPRKSVKIIDSIFTVIFVQGELS